MVTFEELQEMNGNGVLVHDTRTDSRGHLVKVTLSGAMRVWVTRPGCFAQPVKHGMYNNFLLTEAEIHEWTRVI